MKEEFIELPFERNDKGERFEMKVGNELAFIEFKQKDEKVYLIHTEVTPGLEGRGAATAVIEKTLQYLEANHYRLIPLCPLVVAYLKRHPEWNILVD
ncbi:N-acetyltransferase [Flavihumibacter rivuli]|uniref:GNAT family N-acetyltransferase n=1 Tax=Flavihumibacter rivuli TaxID=2838156 RepID=UPI001BDF35EF|nr:GNAT family N-acetyltransferase [Flavihumibacter rivuli]ULQ56528.1 N-acetyltransferase [Flavihumibacter rivuli]